LEMASTHQPDILLLDVAMPMTSGCQVAEQLSRENRFRNPLLIAITGWTDQAHRLRCEEAGFHIFLTKPVEPATIEVLLALEQGRLDESTAVTHTPAKCDRCGR